MIVDQDEGTPASYPTVSGLSTAADALDADALWQRIEQWIAHRWGERSVTWTVQGPADFIPPLKPYTVDTVEKWTGAAFETVTLDPVPIGLSVGAGTYRITATVGTTDDPPAAVIEAFRRFAEYLADERDMGRVITSQSVNLESGLSYDYRRPANWLASALQHSGGADLLRGYR